MIDSAYGDWISFDGVPYTQGPGFMTVQKAKNYVLMQWTGLKDKNGKEIWEGDIIETQAKTKLGHIVFYNGSWRISIHDTKTPISVGFGYWKTYTVIGNIYQNPELLCNTTKRP